jgi:cell wall-associated NlpC family hydrolase
MNVQVPIPRSPVTSWSVAALAMVVAVLCASRAQAQVTVGPVTIDVPAGTRSSAAAQAVITAIGVADRIAHRRRKSPTSSRGSDPDRGEGSPASTRTTSPALVLPTAERYLGVPYKWGGTSPRTGFDCSGFVQYVFARHGTRLPRTSREMASSGKRLRPEWSALAPGDLVLFAEPGKRISHVAIYAGHRRIIQSSSSGGGVRYDALDTKRGKWFTRRLVAARRVSTHGAALVSDLLARQPADGVATTLGLDPPDDAPVP